MGLRGFIRDDLNSKYYGYLAHLIDEEGDLPILQQLFLTPFYYSVDHDNNREVEGLDLRIDTEWEGTDIPCSVLEMLIALAGRINDIMSTGYEDERTTEWFWTMLYNLKLTPNTTDSDEIEYILTRFMDRTYAPNGSGGLFPLLDTDEDQREIEIWYQMSAYLREQYDLEG